MKNTAEFAKRQGRKAPKSVLQHYCISSLRLSRCKHSDYNTIQKAVREWKPLTGNEALYYGLNVRFHKLKPKDVPQEYKATYNRWLTLYMQVEQIYKETKA